ncbi:PLP-dependent aminotransferase family protein [Nesterenkonia massiliensis]|uniref:PLP-dependent aminotransferase family protein n=1 Tax=Nesterenkonia massiliensis TaxID=1232429 RepID=A0ABT2HTC5_9MICC|nr:PLP-dependent aminotransferase family protein [Nesterenkonia massiliensis]MCT1607949.1 PLP-dependent aminotransferase family protein [Nesterenkonia massiliensis]
MSELDAVALSRRLSTRTPSGIAEQIRDLIDAGDLPPGTRLPTVRDIAQEIGVSVGTIAQAWSILREENAVETRRRGGTRVIDAARAGKDAFRSFSEIDLLLGSPDPALLAPLEEAISTAARQPDVNVWARETIAEDLQKAAQAVFPYEPQACLAVGGGSEGLWSAVRAAAQPGQAIAVETPFSPGFLMTARQMGLTLIPVATDDDGAVPASLRSALEEGAVAFVHTPSGAFGSGHLLTEARARELAAVLEDSAASVVEDDPLGPLAVDPGASLGTMLPERTLRVQAYCRAFGVDLRTGILGGPQELVDRAAALRAEGLGSVSRILQHALAALLTSKDAQRRVNVARRHYEIRKSMAVEALREAGLKVHSGPASWSLWIEVAHEEKAALALASQGVAVDIGSTSFIEDAGHPRQQNYLRLTIAQLPEDAAHLSTLAQMIGKAAAGELRPAFV